MRISMIAWPDPKGPKTGKQKQIAILVLKPGNEHPQGFVIDVALHIAIAFAPNCQIFFTVRLKEFLAPSHRLKHISQAQT